MAMFYSELVSVIAANSITTQGCPEAIAHSA